MAGSPTDPATPQQRLLVEQQQVADLARAELIALYGGITVTLIAGIMVALDGMMATPFGRAAVLRKMLAFTRQIVGMLPVRRMMLVDRLLTAETQAGRHAAAANVDSLVRRARNFGNAPIAPVRRPSAPSGAPPARPFSAPASAVGRVDRSASGSAPGGASSVPHGVRAEASIRAELNRELEAAEQQILRLPDMVMREVASEAAIQNVLANGITPAEAMARAWRDFQAQGITGFTDQAGRKWTLASYTEMAIRTASAHAFNAAVIEALTGEGIDLYTVPAHVDPCPLCARWENAILSLTPNPQADATLAHAEAEGLFHPNCRHSLVGFMRGLSIVRPRTIWTPAAQARYVATQQQRYLERLVRRRRQQSEYALSSNQRVQAAREVRDLQARLRRHVAEHGNLTREPSREQPDLGFNKGGG